MSELQSSTQRSGPAAVEGEDASEKYLTFRLDDEEYGLEILKVREIIGLMSITPVPRAPSDVRGVINLRGKIIPVVDLRSRFEMSTIDDTERSCIIVVDVAEDDESVDMGLLVDSVSEVLDIKSADIGPAPRFGASVDTDFILGMAKIGDRVTILLEVEKVLSTSEVEAATRAAKASEELEACSA